MQPGNSLMENGPVNWATRRTFPIPLLKRLLVPSMDRSSILCSAHEQRTSSCHPLFAATGPFFDDGHSQLIVLPDPDLLLVLSEKGELALVAASHDQFRELARFPAIEGKTWNHPVLVGDILLARNDREMVAFRLSLAGH